MMRHRAALPESTPPLFRRALQYRDIVWLHPVLSNPIPPYSGGTTCALVLVRWAFLHELVSIHVFVMARDTHKNT